MIIKTDILCMTENELRELESNGEMGCDLSPGDSLCKKAAAEIRADRRLLVEFMKYFQSNVELLDKLLTAIKVEKKTTNFEDQIIKT